MKLAQQHIGDLIAKCRENDQTAQMEVYQRYYKAMFNTSLRIVKDSAEAEDLMQEAFLTAFTKLSSLHNNDHFGSWLKRIVINNSLTALKKKKDHQEFDMELIAQKPTNTNEDIDLQLQTIQAQQLVDTMKTLKDSYSTSLSLYFIEGYDYEEICEIMDITYSNCRTLISRAKESLRKKLIQL